MTTDIRKILAAMLISLGAVCASVMASELPAFEKKVSITVREQAVQEFLETLFAQVGVPVVVSEEIDGLLNGRFEGTAQKIFDDVAQAFNVTLYFDGAVAHVYGSNEVTRTVMPLSGSAAKRVQQIAARMSLGDSNNRVDSSGGSGLMVVGTRRFMEQIEEISFSVQANAEIRQSAPLAYRVFYLSNAWAADTSFNVGGQSVTISGVATLLQQLIAEGRLPSAATEQRPSRSGNTLEGLRGRGLQSVGTAETLESNSQPLALENVFTASGARIVADSRLNAIIIRDAADRMAAYQQLINDLDRPSQMVEIEATIIDVNTDRTRELGVGWQYRRSDGDVSVIGGAVGQSATTQPGGLIQGPGAILSTVLGRREQFLARIQALEERGAARIVSKPHVITLSDVEAVLGATTEFFVRVAGAEEVDLFNVPVGTTLRVTPHVFQETGQSRIKLLVNIEDGAASAQQVDDIPVIERANINTQAVINEGDSLLIGGLVRDSYRQTSSSVPLLGSIPILGRLFKSTANTSSRVERLFMITPRSTSGLGFGRVHNGRRSLPILQGDAEDIQAQASDRVKYPDQPFGGKVNDIPFKPIQLPAGKVTDALTETQELPGSRATQPVVPGQNPQPEYQQWVAIPGSESFNADELSERSVAEEDEWTSIPVIAPQRPVSAVPSAARESQPDDDGWVVVK